MEIKVRKINSNYNTTRVETAEDFKIPGETLDECLATYFREYLNRFKYVNDLNFKLIDAEVQEAYKVWISDVRNYAANGGDMW